MIKIKAYYVVTVKEKGKIIKVVKGDSCTLNAWFSRTVSLIFRQGDVANTIIVKNTSGTDKTLRNAFNYSLFQEGIAANRKINLVIGDDNTAFSRTHFNLQGLIAAFDYSSFLVSDNGSKVTIAFSGSWLNTGELVTVREIGFKAWFIDDANSSQNVLLCRDVIDNTEVDTNKTVTVGYVIEVLF